MAIYVKPFTQIYEDVMLEMRENSTDAAVEKKYKRRVNDIYVREIRSKFEWDWLRAVGTITLKAKYSTGTVSVVNGSAAVVGTGTTWTSAMTGMKFTVPNTNEIYTFTRTAATTGTISPVYQGATNATASYAIFEYVYPMASDYSRMTTEPGLYYDYSTGRTIVEWKNNKYFRDHFTTQSSTFPTFFAEYPVKSSTGLLQIQIMPPVDTARILSYEYIKALPELTEFTTGTATTSAGSASVTTSSDYSAFISAGQYFRIDADSTWSKITTVSTTTLTLADLYPSSNTTASYTVSDVPDIPYTLHEALFYGGCYLTAKEQNSTTQMQAYLVAFLRAMDLDMAQRNRKRYGRQYMQRLGIK
jgi:hypothetical protein